MIGLIDSGVDAGAVAVAAQRRFAGEGWLEHGTVLAAIIARLAPAVPLLSAQVFDDRAVASASAVAEALDWLVDQGARLVNMSLGLTADRAVLAQACARAVAGGVVLVASVPAIGPLVWPAAYAGVVRVTGDARCRDDELAWLDDGRVHFGACPCPEGRPEGQPRVAGASVAAARVTGLLAAIADADPVARLAAAACHRGPQRRKVATP